MENIQLVKEEHIKDLLNRSEVIVNTVFGRNTVVSVKLPNGFIITESTGCIDERNYSEEIGAEICMSRIEDKLWELEGYLKTVQLDSFGKMNKIVQGDS